MDNNTPEVPQEQPVQEPLFDLDTIPAKEASKRRKYWYYLTRRRNEEMLVGFADDGTPLWCEHDKRIVTPHLFSTSHQARKAKGKELWSVCKYEFTQHSGR